MMPIFVEWWPEHVVESPAQMMANQMWAERVFTLLKEGGIAVTDAGGYVKRDGGLHRIDLAEKLGPPPKKST